MSLSTEQLQTFAEHGVRARLAELEHERQALLQYLNGNEKVETFTPAKAQRRARKRKGMTAAQRKAVGVRMRKYWAARRRDEA